MALAIEMSQYGPPSVLRLVERRIPELRPDEVLIDVVASAVNRSDVNVRSGRHPILKPNPFPYIPGIETVGTVAAKGAHVELPLGAHVITMMQKMGGVHAHRPGAYQTHVVAPVTTVATLEPRVDLFSMAALGLAAVTAYQGLLRIGVKAGDRILITGASGGVGSAALRLAKAWGAWTIAVTTQSAKGDHLRETGADEVWDLSDGGWDRQRSGSVDGVLELVGGDTFRQSIQTLKRYGRLCVVGALAGGETTFSVWDLLDEIAVTGYSSEHLDGFALQDTVDRLTRLLDQGRLQPPAFTRYALAEAASAHEAMERNQVEGRMLLVPGLTASP